MDVIAQDSTLLAATSALALVGLVYGTCKLASFIKMLLDVFVLKGISLRSFGSGQGAWAVVTGATDGIGKEFAKQLAKNKFNVLLVSRTASKLETAANEIASEYGVETKIFAMDFTKGDAQDFRQLGELMATLDIGVLVNNVGTNHDIPTSFADEDDKVINDIIEVNVKGALKMTKLVLPYMREKRRGLILNLGSFAGLVATPYLSVYSAGKAFLSTWSQALGTELQAEGIVVEHVNTYFVVSAMSKIRKPNVLVPLVKPYVTSVLAKIGLPCGADIPFTSTPYYTHGLVNWIINNVFSKTFWVNKNDAIQKDIRKRALRKREREAAAARKSN